MSYRNLQECVQDLEANGHLVRVDAEERLILLGEGRELIEPRGPVAPSGDAK